MKVKIELPGWVFIQGSKWPTQRNTLEMFFGEGAIHAGIVNGLLETHDPIFGVSSVEWGTDAEGKPFVEGISTSCNKARVTWPLDSDCTSHGYFEFSGARHALRDDGNEAGMLFAFIFGSRMEDLPRLKVVEYESWRLDADWWEYGLERQPTP